MDLNKITSPYFDLFPGDLSGNTRQRQTPKVLFAATKIAGFPEAELICFNETLSHKIGLGSIEKEADRHFLTASSLPENIKTYATAYAGHQFGNWAGQLGDGRAIFAGEITNSYGKKTELQWKGAGATPYSRHADGRAVLRSSIREYLMSEAMFYLGVPTTRALSLSLTGEKVERDMMYNGNPQFEKGAVVVRTAESFLRFGHFQLLTAQDEIETLRKLADYTIANFYKSIDPQDPQKYAELFRQICARTADMIVEWYRVGFTHGVMNTDNMSVLGLTIDYGPFSFLDEYDLSFTPNTTDMPGRRYAFGQQAKIAQWNLWQLASALFPLVKDVEILENILNSFSDDFWKKHDQMMAAKFGFNELLEGDDAFFAESQKIMEDLEIDYTLFFSQLEKLSDENDVEILFKDVFYAPVSDGDFDVFKNFIQRYQSRLAKNSIPKMESLELMRKTNPKFILRNYILFECIAELEVDERNLFNKIQRALENPYEELFAEFSKKRPAIYNDQSGCSTLSCSS